MPKSYSRDYYEERQRRTEHSARAILDIVLERCGPIDSAVDIGCGVGTWLSVLAEKGATRVLGVDGPWVDQDLLVIPADRFQRANLSEPLALQGNFDLAISLEVAEHLPRERAEGLVATLTGLADRVLFSAAVPRQGGARHINEQWQSYWVQLFDSCGYDVHDFIRSRIWTDERIPYWYRQNTLFFSRRGVAFPNRATVAGAGMSTMPLDVVHPALFLKRVRPRRRLRDRLNALLRRKDET